MGADDDVDHEEKNFEIFTHPYVEYRKYVIEPWILIFPLNKNINYTSIIW